MRKRNGWFVVIEEKHRYTASFLGPWGFSVITLIGEENIIAQRSQLKQLGSPPQRGFVKAKVDKYIRCIANFGRPSWGAGHDPQILAAHLGERVTTHKMMSGRTADK
jgi:hypothetical protein